MRGTKLKIGLDVDDVLMECIPFLVERERAAGTEVSLDDFCKWGISTPGTEKVYKHFSDPWFYKNQPPAKGAQTLVKTLCKFADVFIISATAPEFMSERAKRVMELFPEIPKGNIILGARKDIVSDLDILLDDAEHNIQCSKAKFPVLMRRPWNTAISGMLSVNNFDDFLRIVKTIMESNTEPQVRPNVICMIGPSGSGKHRVANTFVKRCENSEKLRSYSTADNKHHKKVSSEEFDKLNLFEKTFYAGHKYGMSRDDINDIVWAGKIAVVVTDICGAMTIKNNYHALLVYVDCDIRTSIKTILTSSSNLEENVERIVSIEKEKKNENLCDLTVSGKDENAAVEEILRFIA